MLQVAVYAYVHNTPESTPHLEKRAAYRTSTAPIDIYVSDNKIAVADLMKSISVLEYTPSSAGLKDKLTELCRHYSTLWSTALTEIDENQYLVSDGEGNLVVLERNIQGATEDDMKRMLMSASCGLGEIVNRIRRIDVAARSDATVLPRAFLATVEGSLYLFALITPPYLNFLINLQSNLASQVISPGNIPFEPYRAFRNIVSEESGPVRFVDGELIQAFLDVDSKIQESVVQGLTIQKGQSVKEVSVSEVIDIVESLRRLT
jgi:DNA damage-binding protein 1